MQKENKVESTLENRPDSTIEEKIKAQIDQSMLLGAQTISKTIIGKIFMTKDKRSKITFRDYERLVNDIEDFCITVLSKETT